MSSLDTEHWKFYAQMGYNPLPLKRIKCTYCGGSGEVGGGLGDPDGPVKCYVCMGHGEVDAEERQPRPEIPQSLVEHMKNAFNTWYDAKYPGQSKEK